MTAKPPTMRAKVKKPAKASPTPVGKTPEERTAYQKMAKLQPMREVPACPVWQLDTGTYFTHTNVSLETAQRTSEVYLIVKLNLKHDPKIVRVKRMGIGRSASITPTIVVRPYEVAKPSGRKRAASEEDFGFTGCL